MKDGHVSNFQLIINSVFIYIAIHALVESEFEPMLNPNHVLFFILFIWKNSEKK